MKAFWTYTLARFIVFGISFGVVWLIAQIFLDSTAITNLFVLLIALVLSSAVSLFVLSSLRDRLAGDIQARAARMTERIEESRRAEDVD